MPLMPEILKSSNNLTVLSRKGSAGSESRTYNVSHSRIHIFFIVLYAILLDTVSTMVG